MSDAIALYSLLSDLVLAALNGLDLWPAVLGALMAALLIRLPLAARLILGLSLTLLLNSLWPLWYGLPPVTPDFGAPEFVIQFAILSGVVFAIILGLNRLRPLRFART